MVAYPCSVSAWRNLSAVEANRQVLTPLWIGLLATGFFEELEGKHL